MWINIYRDVAGFDMSYEEFKGLCREAWKDEDYIYIYIGSSEVALSTMPKAINFYRTGKGL